MTRPTKDQVDDALEHVDLNPLSASDPWQMGLRPEHVLAAEVRVLQAERDALQSKYETLCAAAREFKRMVKIHSDATASDFWPLMEDALDAALQPAPGVGYPDCGNDSYEELGKLRAALAKVSK